MFYFLIDTVTNYFIIILLSIFLSFATFHVDKYKNKNLNLTDFLYGHLFKYIFFIFCVRILHRTLWWYFVNLFLCNFYKLQYALGIAQLWLYKVNLLIYLIHPHWFDELSKKNYKVKKKLKVVWYAGKYVPYIRFNS